MPVTTLRTGLGQLGGVMIETARAALNGAGTLVLRGSVEAAAVEAAHAAVVEGLCGLDAEALARRGVRVGEKRYMVSLDLDPPFDRPALFASPPLVDVARALLGSGAVINSFAVVIAFPGAPAQRIHVDHEPLFPRDDAASMAAPVYALTGIVPLLDLSEATGSTEVWPLGPTPGVPDAWTERRTGSTVLSLDAGDAAFIDYRVCHGGTANPGPAPRPILYIVYSRPWFRDADNFSEMPPLRVTPTHLARMPAEYRTLFAAAAAGHRS
jgi:hypothetical protein